MSVAEHSLPDSLPFGELNVELLFVRHATDTRPGGILDGHEDPGLTDEGKAQANRLAIYLGGKSIDFVICSPKLRAIQTHNLAVANAKVRVSTLDDRVGEYDWGDWAGYSFKEMFDDTEKDRAEAEGYNYRPNPAAETMLEVHDRMLQSISDQAIEYRNTHSTNKRLRAVVFGHSFAEKATAGVIAGIDRETIAALLRSASSSIRNCAAYTAIFREDS